MAPINSRSRCQSWVNAIPLGSLDQLQHATLDSVQGQAEEQTNVTILRLPESRPSSFDQSSPSSRATTSPAVRNVHLAQEPTVEGTPSKQGTPTAPDADNDQSISGGQSTGITSFPTWNASESLYTASAGSSWQLENAGPAAELLIQLPASVNTPVTDDEPTVQAAAGSAPSVSSNGNERPDVSPKINAEPNRAPPRGTGTRERRTRDRQAAENVKHNYWQKMQPLMGCLPHLKTIGSKHGRHNNVGTHDLRSYYQSRGNSAPATKSRGVADPEVSTRMLLIEDLSADLIEVLGDTFSVDPEFFAEHLNRSGYDKMDHDDPPPSQWETRNMPKEHASMKWYRPVKQNAKVTEWLKKPHLLLDGVSIDENSVNDDESIVNSPGRMTWSDPTTADGSRLEHSVSIGTNIFRRSWPLSTRPITQNENNAESQKWMAKYRNQKGIKSKVRKRTVYVAGEVDWKAAPIPTAWEEKASVFRFANANGPKITISDFRRRVQQQRKKKRSNGSVHRDQAGRGAPVEMSIPMIGRCPLDFPANKFEATRDDIARLKRSTESVSSTLDAIRAQADRTTAMDFPAFRADPILALLRVVQIDSAAFFQSLEWALDEISQDSLDDFLMTRRLADWRQLMSDFEIEVPAIGESVNDFVSFVFGQDPDEDFPDEIRTIVDQLDADIARVKHRLDEAYMALRADMQFTESRRSIDETKTVTKLTELAFLFIPLSFTCSLFSMSIKELQNGVPVWTFVATAVVTALLSYGVRVIIASDFIADAARAATEKFWARRNVRRGESAPLLILASLTLQELWANGGSKLVLRCAFVGFMSAFIVLPVAFMWNSTHLDNGLYVAVTLFIILSGLSFVCFAYVFDRQSGWTGSGSVASDDDV